jgi:hypothetical protein
MRLSQFIAYLDIAGLISYYLLKTIIPREYYFIYFPKIIIEGLYLFYNNFFQPFLCAGYK